MLNDHCFQPTVQLDLIFVHNHGVSVTVISRKVQLSAPLFLDLLEAIFQLLHNQIGVTFHHRHLDMDNVNIGYQ